MQAHHYVFSSIHTNITSSLLPPESSDGPAHLCDDTTKAALLYELQPQEGLPQAQEVYQSAANFILTLSWLLGNQLQITQSAPFLTEQIILVKGLATSILHLTSYI